MRSTRVSPSAHSPAITRLADARRSVAITFAPDSWSTPVTSAVLPSTVMCAPSRFSSCTCMKRFSKIVSTTCAVPLAIVFSAMNCACMSVGNAGYSEVRMVTAEGRRSIVTRSQSPPSTIVTPASRSLSITASRMDGRTPVSVTSPPAAATAHRNVPASMRSGITAWRAPCSRSTPWITSRSVPIPSIRAPIATSRCARSLTSGSRAAFSITVSPSARVAAISRFSVPVTVIMSVTIRAPFRRVARASMKPCSRLISAPIACRPLMCWSTGRAPIAQPPGSDTFASPKRARSGPSTRIDARIVLTSSYGATGLSTRPASSRTRAPSVSVRMPIWPSSLSVVRTSCRFGTLSSSTGSADSSPAHRIGSAAFFAPDTAISPLRR